MTSTPYVPGPAPAAGPAVAAAPAAAPPGVPGPVTAEGAVLDVRPARLASRALARLVDLAVQACLAVVLLSLAGLLVAALPAALLDGAMVGLLQWVLVVVVLIGYPVTVETLWNGVTPGKAAVGLRVLREDGGPIRLRHALARALVGFAVEFPGLLLPPVTWLVALGTMLGSDRGRRLGDLAAGTVVAHVRAPAGWAWLPGMPPQLAGWAAGLDLSGLDDELAAAVRHYLSRARTLHEPEGGRLGRRLGNETAQRLGQSPPPGVPPWLFLTAVLAERRRRAGLAAGPARALADRVWPGFGRVR